VLLLGVLVGWACACRVEHVSCGPFHAAAISDAGCLYTWGDGMFGKLGHGEHSSSYTPRVVDALADHFVISVSCGWWHTAAAAVHRTSMVRASSTSLASTASSYSSEGGSSITRSSAFARYSRSCSALSKAVGVCGGGSMFTWGGDFTWQQCGKRDHHEGCLGLGDLAGEAGLEGGQ